MKKITCLLLLIQSGFMMAQTKTVVTQNGEKVTIHPNANNGITANAGYIQLGGDLKQATKLVTTSTFTLALEGLLAGANTDAVLVIDNAGIIRYVSRSEFAGDNLGDHTATQDLNMNAKNIAGAANITATGKTSTATAQISTGASIGYVATSVDAAGNVVWTDPTTITTKGDNLGNHIATQDLNMNTKNIAGAANITATGKTSTATAQISTDAGDGKIAVSDATGNVIWTDPTTITTKGDNLGNHIATQDLNMNTKNIAGAANITATGKTTTATAQISTGAGDGKIAVSDATGNVTWTDPTTIATKGDNLGNHIATQDLNMSTFNVNGAGNVTATGTITGANVTATGKTTTATAQISTGAAVGYVATSVDAVGNVVWTDPATFATQLTIDEFTTSAGDASFTLSATPQALKVQMYVNGVAISKNAISVAGTNVTYLPANNGSYTLMANDLIKFSYLK